MTENELLEVKLTALAKICRILLAAIKEAGGGLVDAEIAECEEHLNKLHPIH